MLCVADKKVGPEAAKALAVALKTNHLIQSFHLSSTSPRPNERTNTIQYNFKQIVMDLHSRERNFFLANELIHSVSLSDFIFLCDTIIFFISIHMCFPCFFNTQIHFFHVFLIYYNHRKNFVCVIFSCVLQECCINFGIIIVLIFLPMVYYAMGRTTATRISSFFYSVPIVWDKKVFVSFFGAIAWTSETSP